MESSNRNHANQDDINLKELSSVLWRGKWLMLGITVACGLAAGFAAFTVQKKYEAKIEISPLSDSPDGKAGGGGALDLASSFGGLASLAGLSSPGNSRRAETLAVLKSEVLTEEYIKNNNLLPILYSSKWDAEHNTWRSMNPEAIPTLWKANRFFDQNIRVVTTDAKTGLVTMRITWKDPQQAAQWANDLVKLTNDYLRKKALEESERNIAYLNEQAAKTDIVGIKLAIYSLLQTEINKSMLARGSAEYALKVLDPAVAPELPTYPQKQLWILLGIFAGLSISAITVLVRGSAARSDH
jgi:capsular polysaccharide biosynthesis protein